MSSKKIIAFDLDGTLVDSMGRLTEIASEVMSAHFGITPEEATRLYQETSGLAFPDQLRLLYPDRPETNEKAADLFQKMKKASYFQEKIFGDAQETIGYLKSKGYTIVISSNSEQELVDGIVRRLEIPCDLALGYRKNFAKGLPHFLHILERFGRRREEVVFIGDSLKDLERARECEIDFIGKEGIFSARDFQKQAPGIPVISNLAELKEMF